LVWKRHPAALCVRGARPAARCACRVSREVHEAREVELRKGWGAGVAGDRPGSAEPRPGMRREGDAVCQEGWEKRGLGVEAASCRFVRKRREACGSLRVIGYHPNFTKRAKWSCGRAGGLELRGIGPGAPSPGPACGGRGTRSARRDGRSGALVWKRHPAALCVRGARPAARCACRVSPKLHEAREVELRKGWGAGVAGDRPGSAEPRPGMRRKGVAVCQEGWEERGLGVEAASCRFVRKRREACGSLRVIGYHPNFTKRAKRSCGRGWRSARRDGRSGALVWKRHPAALCVRGARPAARCACRVSPKLHEAREVELRKGWGAGDAGDRPGSAEPRPGMRRKGVAVCQEGREERGLGVEAASCRFVRKRREACGSLRVSGITQTSRSARSGAAEGGGGLPGAMGEAGPWCGSGILPLCA
jgi:hypothetical protein